MATSSGSLWLNHYGLREQPFGVTPNPRYLYLSPTHGEALASLVYGIEAGRGFMALIAQPGMGKTTLLFRLLERLRTYARTVFLFQTQCDSAGLMHALLGDLGIDTEGHDLGRMYQQLNEVLIGEAHAGRRFVLVIDEAQNLDDSVLETVRMMSNFETPSAKLMQIILAGQPQLAEKLARPGLAQLRQRVSILCRLKPFTLAETNQYIDHRLRVAGYSGSQLFTNEAREIVAARSRGIPRDINNLCFNALSLGYALDKEKIDASVIQEVIADLDVAPLVAEAPLFPQTTFTNPVKPVAAVVPEAAALPRQPSGPTFMRRLSVWAAVLSALFVGGGAYLKWSVGRPNSKPANRALPSTLPAAPGSASPSHTVVSSGPASAQVPSPPARVGSEPSTTVPPVTGERRDGPELRKDGTAESFVVTVRPAQTLEEISQRYFGRFDSSLLAEIRALNPALSNPNRIDEGESIRLPKLSDPGAKLNAKTASRAEPPALKSLVNMTRVKMAIEAGDALLERGDYDSAIRTYEGGLAGNPASKDLRTKIERAKSAKAAEAKYIN